MLDDNKIIRYRRDDVSTDGMDTLLMQEIAWMREQLHREQEEKDREAAERLNEEIAAAEGGLIECGCCYSESPFEKMVQCSEGHLFCKSCLQVLTATDAIVLYFLCPIVMCTALRGTNALWRRKVRNTVNL